MYGIVGTASYLIRQFCLPNPFECFGDMAVIYNWITGAVIAPIAFLLVGLFYKRGSAPALGSLLYLLMYAALTGILRVMGLLSFAWWWVLLVVVAIITIIVGIRKILGAMM